MISICASGDALMVLPFPAGYKKDRTELSEYIKRADLRLTNLETTITDGNVCGSAYSGGTWVTADERILDELIGLGFNCFGTANNHTMDYSYDGLAMTVDALKRRGAAFAGSGRNLEEAEAAAVIPSDGGEIAVISVCSTFDPAAAAGYSTPYLPGRPGLNYLRFTSVYEIHADEMAALRRIEGETGINGLKNLHRRQGFIARLPEGIYEFGGTFFREVSDEKPSRRTSSCNKNDLARICREIVKNRRVGRYVVVQFHSHEVKTDSDEEADYFIEEFAHACIDAGACAVIGGGTHQLKGIEIYKNAPVFYSLGNFVFQNSKVKKLPADFMEKYGLPTDATAQEALRARSATATSDLADSLPCFRSVLPYIELEDGGVKKIQLMPLDLGKDLQGEMRNIPHPASAETTAEILRYLERVSAEYGTHFVPDGGGIRVKIGE